MRRRLFTLASALSLLLCMAALALWVVSYRVTCAVSREYARPSPRRAGVVRGQATAAEGTIYFVREVDDTPPTLLPAGPPRSDPRVRWHVRPRRGADLRRSIFRFEPDGAGGGPFRWAFQFEAPLWVVVMLLAVPPAARTVLAHRKRRRRQNAAARPPAAGAGGGSP